MGVLHAQLKPAPALKNSMDVLDDHRVIGPGYLLSIRILEERRESEQRMVPQNGVIEIPHVGPVKVQGMTCRKLAQFVAQKLTTSPAFTQIMATQRPLLPDSKGPTVVVAIDNWGTCVPYALGNPQPATKLRPGWTIGIRIVEDKREKLQQVIAVTGEIQAPYVGLVKAGGLTCEEVAVNIKRELEKAFFLTATVLVTLDSTEREPKEWTKGCFSKDMIVVFGNVAKAGKYDLSQKGELTVSGFLQWAGGHTSKKLLPKIQIVRKTPQGNKRILVDAEAILVRKSKEHDLFLRSDDVMLVD